MKNKIPFIATIANAYRFTFRNFLPIAAVIAGPLLVQMIIGYFLLDWMIRVMAGMLAEDYSALKNFLPYALGYVGAGILTFVQFAAVSELALGTRQPAPFSFPLGKPVWRLIGAFLIALLVIALFLIALAITVFITAALLGVAAAAISPEMGKLISTIAVALGMLVIEGALFFIIFRLTFLLAPVTLISERIDLRQAWRLTKGNFWRIFGIWIGILVPFAILEYALIFAAIGLPPAVPPGASHGAEVQAQLSYNIAMFQAALRYWYISVPFLVAGAVFVYGAVGGAQAFAYRALIGEVSAPIAGD